MKKTVTFLCGITAAILITGCGSSIMPDLTEEETEIISDYAAGVLLNYDRVYSGRLMSKSEYEEAEIKKMEKAAASTATSSEQNEESTETEASNSTEIVDISQDEAAAVVPSTIEEYYGIQNFAFQYAGYELVQSYPSGAEDDIYFSMDATAGMQLLVIKFTASNISSADQTLNMLDYGARFRVSVNGGAGENALTTMLLNDMQGYNDVVSAGSSVELVSIVEIPQSTAVETIDFTLRGDAGNSVIQLQ